MTAIAGFVEAGRVWIGGDSAGVSNQTLSLTARPKVFRRGPYLFGFANSYRLGQVLQYKFQPPRPPADPAGLHSFLVLEFVESFREMLSESGANENKEGIEGTSGSSFLVGIRGRLFRLDSDYQIGECQPAYDAIGAGGDAALGALSALEGFQLKPRKRLTLVLEAAERHCSVVRRPFTILSNS